MLIHFIAVQWYYSHSSFSHEGKKESKDEKGDKNKTKTFGDKIYIFKSCAK